jgi:hypothetical protein
MKRLIIFLVSTLTVLLLSAWTPTVNIGIPVVTTGVEFEDSGFDYYAKDYGYIHLVREGDVVIVRLNNVPEGGLKLSYDEIEKPDDEDNEFSRDTLQAKTGLDIGKNAMGINITFRDTGFEKAKSYFLDEFVAMNFRPVEVMQTQNTLAFDCGCSADADVHMRVVFTEQGEDIVVHISTAQ